MADKKSILTLNLGSQRLGMARFSAGGKGTLTLTQYAFAEIGGDPTADAARLPQTATAIKGLVGQFKAANEGVRYAISGQPVFSRFVKLPPLGADKVDELIGFEAQQSIPFPIHEVVWDHQVLNKDGAVGEVEAVLVAMKSDALAELNTAVESAPLSTDGVNVAPLALYNAFRYNYPEVTQPVLLIDLGARTINLIYMEAGGKVFFRSIPNVGGAAITSSLAKEFGIDFIEAENRKVSSGFVALSGYADHDDPELAAMSKVIRNSLTRTHGEVVRTANLYRSQQGGSAPEHVFLCGGGASLPYIKEFLEEKLNLPVDFFNALKNVAVGPKVAADQAGHDAHMLGELVGLALREARSCPMEIDLVPPVVAQRRDNAARKPFLFTAAACLFGLLGAGILYHNSGKSHLASEKEQLDQKKRKLQQVADKIYDQDKRLKEEQARAEYLEGAVQDRSYWLEVCKELNSLMKTDLIWLTQIQPMWGYVPVTEGLTPKSLKPTFEEPTKSGPRDSKAPKAEPMIDGIHVFGLYRDIQNDRGADVVNDYFKELVANAKLIDLPKDAGNDISKYVKPTAPDGEHWAYKFEMRLPLHRKLKIPAGPAKASN